MSSFPITTSAWKSVSDIYHFAQSDDPFAYLLSKTAAALAAVVAAIATPIFALLDLFFMAFRDEKPVVQKAVKIVNDDQTTFGTIYDPSVDSVKIGKAEFVKKVHKKQVEAFRKAAQEGRWERFDHRNSHYDWWAFPITRMSSYNDLFSVTPDDIELLKKDLEFMKRFREGVKLVVNSWGWDLDKDGPIIDKKATQTWIGYEVRLGKMADSLNLFGEKELLHRLQNFARQHDIKEEWVRANLQL